MVEFHFLARLKVLGSKYSKASFPLSSLSRSNHIQLDHSKQSHSTGRFKKSFRKREEVHDKSDKKQQRVEGVQPEVDVMFSNLFYAHFLFN